MQKDYKYKVEKGAGRSFDPDFKPELTPKQMLQMGVFGGKYMTDCKKEFPSNWFRKAKLSPKSSMKPAYMQFSHIFSELSLAM